MAGARTGRSVRSPDIARGTNRHDRFGIDLRRLRYLETVRQMDSRPLPRSTSTSPRTVATCWSPRTARACGRSADHRIESVAAGTSVPAATLCPPPVKARDWASRVRPNPVRMCGGHLRRPAQLHGQPRGPGQVPAIRLHLIPGLRGPDQPCGVGSMGTAAIITKAEQFSKRRRITVRRDPDGKLADQHWHSYRRISHRSKAARGGCADRADHWPLSRPRCTGQACTSPQVRMC